MSKFLFRFGFCTPLQWKGNEANGWDDESSSAFIVMASSEEEALARGADVVEAAVAKLFVSEGWSGATPSWKAADFAHWLEPNTSGTFTDQQLESLSVVTPDNEPNHSLILGLSSD